MMRTDRPVTVTLGNQRERLEVRVRSGAYGSESEVLRAALAALDREDAALDDLLRRRIRQADEDPGSSIPADEVFADLWAEHDAGNDGQ